MEEGRSSLKGRMRTLTGLFSRNKEKSSATSVIEESGAVEEDVKQGEVPIFFRYMRMNEISMTITYFHKNKSWMNAKEMKVNLAPFIRHGKFNRFVCDCNPQREARLREVREPLQEELHLADPQSTQAEVPQTHSERGPRGRRGKQEGNKATKGAQVPVRRLRMSILLYSFGIRTHQS